jgi:hypothetical protein
MVPNLAAKDDPQVVWFRGSLADAKLQCQCFIAQSESFGNVHLGSSFDWQGRKWGGSNVTPEFENQVTSLLQFACEACNHVANIPLFRMVFLGSGSDESKLGWAELGLA